MDRTPHTYGPWVLSALLVPVLLLLGFTPEDRAQLGLSCAPFGWRIVLIVHLAAVLPAALVTARALNRRDCRMEKWLWIPVWALAGLAATAAVILGGDRLVALLEGWKADALAKDLVRTIVAYLVVLPWVVVAACWQSAAARARQTMDSDSAPPLGADCSRATVSPLAVIASVLVAFLPPWLYTQQIVERRAAELDAHLKMGLQLKARAVLTGLRDVDGWQTVSGPSRMQALRRVEATLSRLNREASRILNADASASTTLERAFVLVQLDRLDEAERLLRPLAASSPDALLMLGAIYHDQTRWSASEHVFRQAFDSFASVATHDPRSEESFVTACEGLADAAHATGRHGDVEQVYQDARRRLPGRAGHFSFQLGRHYLAVGRPATAIAEFRAAVRLDPALETLARPLIRDAQVKTPACLLR